MNSTILGKISICVLGTVIALLLLEAGVRLIQSRNLKLWEEASDLQQCCAQDPDLGWRNLPGLDRSRATGNGKRRILFLGDSVMYGFHLQANQTIPAKFSWIAQDVESFNFGVPGYGTDQELLQYRIYGRNAKPSIVVVGVSLCNDAGNVANTSQYGAAKPYFRIHGGELREFAPNTSSIRTKSKLLNMFYVILESRTVNNTEATLNRFVMDAKNEQFVRAVGLTKRILEILTDEIKADGAEPVVLLFPYKKMYLEKAHEEHLLRKECLRIPETKVIDLYRELDADAFIDEYHFNNRGTTIVARLLERELLK